MGVSSLLENHAAAVLLPSAVSLIQRLRRCVAFYLQNAIYLEWAMLGSNQRPLPCEVRSILSWLFAAVQKFLQISIFSLTGYRECSPLFVWVGVLLVQ